MSNVFSIETGNLVEFDEKVATDADEALTLEVEKIATEHQQSIIDRLAAVQVLADQGRVGGFVLIFRDTQTGLFYTDVAANEPVVMRNDIHAFIGCLETIKMEMTDLASMAPFVSADGSMVDPYDNPVEIDFDDL